MRDVSQWLVGLGLDEYAALFDEHKIDFEALAELDGFDLKELGIPLGHRKKILKAIAGLDAPQAPAGVAASGEAERRQVTIMFCDLVGSTELSAELDPEDLRALINEYQDACRAAVAEYDGFVARYMGDGVLAYFGYPKSHENDAERAVLAALSLLESLQALNQRSTRRADSALAARVGIATGLVVVGDLIGEGASRESPVVGETPNIAARLQSVAEPDTVVIAQSTYQLTGRTFECRALGTQALKGVAEPVQAWQVTGTRSVESRFEAARHVGLTPLVGREEELTLLLNRWKRARDGDGRVVLITGEAGIGKSRLTEELRRSVAAEPHVRIGYQCLAHYQNSAFHPVIAELERTAGIDHRHAPAEKLDLLETLLSRSADANDEDLALFADLLSIPNDRHFPDAHLEPAQRKEKTLSALVRRLESLAAATPVLFIFEDVHWIDPSTLELLERIVERAATLPLLVAVTSRPGFEAAWTGQPNTSLISLSRIDRRQSRALVDRIAEHTGLPESVLADIVAKADGIPLFIEELTRTLLESERDTTGSSLDVPATLQDSLMSRLDRLTVGKPVAQVASALGREFTHELLSAVCEEPPGKIELALDELDASGLVQRRGTGSQASCVFKHALIQDVAYQSLLRSARQALHRRIASVLCEEFTDTAELQPEVVARHFTEGGETEQAISYWQRAGDRAAARAAHAEAIGHYSRGLDLLGDMEDAERRATAEVDFNLGLAASMRVVERWDDALQALDRAESVARSHDRPAKLAEVHYLKGNLYFPLGRFEDCLHEHEQSRDIARRAGLLEKEARALGGLGDAYYQRGRMITAERHFDSCVKICQAHGFEQVEVAYLAMRGIARFYELRYEECIADAMSSAAHARRIHNLRAEAVATQVICYWGTDMDRFDEALEASLRSMELCRRLGSVNLGASAQAHHGKLLTEMGRREEGLLALREAYESARKSGLIFVGPTILGYLAASTDDPDERARALREGEQMLETNSLSHNYLRFYRFAIETSLESRDWDNAERYAAALEEFTREEPLPWADLIIERGRALAAHGRGDRSTATHGTLARLLEQARACRLVTIAHALDAALSEPGWSRPGA
ncbi:MAG: AAA family ATPase [Gammaproteobacteria bacterium]|nr:AAA family ATPase [Gammaproteobacteria bacterium]NIR25126.1 AAA family ATPase [Gammaproteobacteria bacterium]NIS06822.1 AAA family ATPase [Gammaproteobacteria bacterium]NIU41592.1 AAA family ATPase [Gammaproteobacteria bacterium]NIV49987.1 AAA family ATPase [Gammaproteobacteria bacterium]